MNTEQAVELTAQWALWGTDAADRAYRVLASSAGDLTAWDFADIAERYGAGTPDRLPQYTVFWVPDSGGPGLVGLTVHEYASYQARDGRSRYDAGGREIIYSRLFCLRYPDLAKHAVTCADLLNAVERQLLPPGDDGPVTLRVTPAPALWAPPRPASFPPDLAAVVAALLLTARPVCVLGADEVPAVDRLMFVDRVLSLLPYGLRATLSAATWASPTARELKLRLFFASARRDDSAGTHHVLWDQRGWGTAAPPDTPVVRRYLGWLRQAGERAVRLLEQETAPARFAGDDLLSLVRRLEDSGGPDGTAAGGSGRAGSGGRRSGGAG